MVEGTALDERTEMAVRKENEARWKIINRAKALCLMHFGNVGAGHAADVKL